MNARAGKFARLLFALGLMVLALSARLQWGLTSTDTATTVTWIAGTIYGFGLCMVLRV